ncbi:MAG TPA: COX15/CtaA family protein [Vicinamibacterales bacterium]|nr:COX15/CtaA family protein [Vicinamibacterales bacterium]
MARLAQFAWSVLAANVAVILWGAYVRATGSGAGCGNHWPLCNGEVVPREAGLATLIEYSHRLSSGIALLAVLALVIWAWRAYERGHPVRTGAALSMFFMLTEAAVGAGLVLFQLVADNASTARALFMAVHLLNTFILLACLALTAWWASGGARPQLAGNTGPAVSIAAGLAALLLVSCSGAVAALGNTLFPSSSLAEALQADVSATSHLLIRLRVLHPVLAVATALGLLAGAPRLASGRGSIAARLARAVALLAAAQVVAGLANVVLLAPVWLQIGHLLLADALWIAFVLLGARVLAEAPGTQSATAHDPLVALPGR